MKKNNTNNIGDIIRKLMKNPKLETRLDELDALDVWNRIIGKQLQTYITDARIHKEILYVKLNSSTLRNELSYKKTEIITKINNKIGKELVKDIILK